MYMCVRCVCVCVRVYVCVSSGLFVPTSDVDVVILNSACKDIPNGLKALAATLMRKQIAKTVQVRGRRSIPGHAVAMPLFCGFLMPQISGVVGLGFGMTVH